MNEGDVYEGAKALLMKAGWNVVGGQPPRGSDVYPVIEVKAPVRAGKGSFEAFKPDLVACRGGIILLVECKPDHSPSDVEKLRAILGAPPRLAALGAEMAQRRLLDRCGVPTVGFGGHVRGALAHGGLCIPLPDLAVLHVEDEDGAGIIVAPTGADPSFEAALS